MKATDLWLPPSNLDEAIKWDAVREHRKRLLSECDWTQLPDAPFSLEEKEAWAIYRQMLRNIPEDFTAPDDVVFPEIPGGAA